MRRLTIGAIWRGAKGKPFGFNFLRVFLPVCVVLWHSLIVCYGPGAEEWFWTGPLRPCVYSIVPAFFALSGFLVAGSLARNDLLSFLLLRAVRIFPPLVFIVCLTAFVLGPVFTELELSAYFRDPRFADYLWGAVGAVRYKLPGVFEGMPADGLVNLQLWTIPFELKSYGLLALLAVFGVVRRPALFFAVACAVMVFLAFRFLVQAPPAVMAQGPMGPFVVLSFLFGAALFYLKDKVPFSLPLFLGCVAAFAVLVWFLKVVYLAALPVAYATVYIGHLNLRFRFVSWLADYSYGIYLYGFPLQQVISYLWPEGRVWSVNFTLGLCAALLCAVLSWHGLEHPILRRKARLLGGVRRALDALPIK